MTDHRLSPSGPFLAGQGVRRFGTVYLTGEELTTVTKGAFAKIAGSTFDANLEGMIDGGASNRIQNVGAEAFFLVTLMVSCHSVTVGDTLRIEIATDLGEVVESAQRVASGGADVPSFVACSMTIQLSDGQYVEGWCTNVDDTDFTAVEMVLSAIEI